MLLRQVERAEFGREEAVVVEVGRHAHLRDVDAVGRTLGEVIGDVDDDALLFGVGDQGREPGLGVVLVLSGGELRRDAVQPHVDDRRGHFFRIVAAGYGEQEPHCE